MNNLTSPCESAALLSVVAKGMNPPPQNAKKWILDNISEEKKKDGYSQTKLLSTVYKNMSRKLGRKSRSRRRCFGSKKCITFTILGVEKETGNN